MYNNVKRLSQRETTKWRIAVGVMWRRVGEEDEAAGDMALQCWGGGGVWKAPTSPRQPNSSSSFVSFRITINIEHSVHKTKHCCLLS